MKVSAYGDITITIVNEPFSIHLSNEAQQFPTDKNRKVAENLSYYTDVAVIKGDVSNPNFTIGEIKSANGIEVSKNANRITFAVKAGTTLAADYGSFDIPVTLDDETLTKTFSWSCQKSGADAKSVKVVAESTVFKSADGGETFSPDVIRITPTFQGEISFLKWQYSSSGGTTWEDVTSGERGLTISSTTLIVSKTCDLYTDSITAISFKCLSSDEVYYDVITIAKLSDSGNEELGGVNLFVKSTAERGKYLTNTGEEVLDESWGYSDYIDVSDIKNYVASGFTNLGTVQSTCFYKIDKTFLSGVESKIENSQDSKRKTLSIPSGASYMRFSFLLADIDTLKIEKGKRSSSYSPAPTDIENSIKETQSSITELSFTVDKQKKEIENKVSQDVYRTDLEVIKSSLADSNEGINKWLVTSYLKSDFPEDYQDKNTIEMFLSKSNILANQTLLIEDDKLSEQTTFSASSDPLVFYALTFAYFSESGIVTTTAKVNGSYNIYINGSLMAVSEDAVRLKFTEGWNCIELVINAPDNICSYYLEKTISELEACVRMNCYEGTITGRSTSIQSKTTELTISLGKINSRVSEVESGVSSSDSQIRELSNKYSELEQDSTKFKTTVSQTYAKKDDFSEIGARNLIKNSDKLIYDNYTFEGQVSLGSFTDSNGNVIADSNGNTLILKETYTSKYTGKQIDDMVAEVK